MDVSPNVAYGNLGKKWRAERNFWISFMCFFLWWCVPGLVLCLHGCNNKRLAISYQATNWAACSGQHAAEMSTHAKSPVMRYATQISFCSTPVTLRVSCVLGPCSLVQRLYQVLKRYQKLEDEVMRPGGPSASGSPAPTRPTGATKKVT